MHFTVAIGTGSTAKHVYNLSIFLYYLSFIYLFYLFTLVFLVKVNFCLTS